MDLSKLILIFGALGYAIVINATTHTWWDIALQLNKNYGLKGVGSDLYFPMDITTPPVGLLYSVPAQTLFANQAFPNEPLYIQLNFQPNSTLFEFYFLAIRDPDGVLRFSISMYKPQGYRVQLRYNPLIPDEGEKTIEFPISPSSTDWRLGVWITEKSVNFFTNCPRLQPAPFHEEPNIKLLGRPLFREGASAFLLNSGLQSNPMYLQGILTEFTLHSGTEAHLAPCKTSEYTEESGEAPYVMDPNFGNVLVPLPDDEDELFQMTTAAISITSEASEAQMKSSSTATATSTTTAEFTTAVQQPKFIDVVPFVILSDMSLRLLNTTNRRLIPNAQIENGFLKLANQTFVSIQEVPGIRLPNEASSKVFVYVNLLKKLTILVNAKTGEEIMSQKITDGIPSEVMRNYNGSVHLQILLDNVVFNMNTYNGTWTVQNGKTGQIYNVEAVKGSELHLSSTEKLKMPDIAINAITGAIGKLSAETGEVSAYVEPRESATTATAGGHNLTEGEINTTPYFITEERASTTGKGDEVVTWLPEISEIFSTSYTNDDKGGEIYSNNGTTASRVEEGYKGPSSSLESNDAINSSTVSTGNEQTEIKNTPLPIEEVDEGFLTTLITGTPTNAVDDDRGDVGTMTDGATEKEKSIGTEIAESPVSSNGKTEWKAEARENTSSDSGLYDNSHFTATDLPQGSTVMPSGRKPEVTSLSQPVDSEIAEGKTKDEGVTESSADSSDTQSEIKGELSNESLTTKISAETATLVSAASIEPGKPTDNLSDQKGVQSNCSCLEKLLPPEFFKSLREEKLNQSKSKDRLYNEFFKNPAVLRVVREVIERFVKQPGFLNLHKPKCNCTVEKDANMNYQCSQPETTSKPIKTVNPSSRNILEHLKEFSCGVIVMNNRSVLANAAFSLARGSMVYVNAEDTFFLKVDESKNIWRTIDMGTQSQPVHIPQPQTTAATTTLPPIAENLVGRNLMLVALDEPMHGDLKLRYKTSRGYTNTVLACQRAAHNRKLYGLFYPLINTDVFNMEYTLLPTHRHQIPIVNFHGKQLFDDFASMIKGEQATSAPILTFEGKEMKDNFMSPCVWVGAKPIYLNGDYRRNARAKCRNWQTRQAIENGLAAHVPMSTNATGFLDQSNLYEESCAKRCHILCIQMSPDLRTRE